jgi:hypothetical protein
LASAKREGAQYGEEGTQTVQAPPQEGPPLSNASLKAFYDVLWGQSHQIAHDIILAVKQGANGNGGKSTHAGSMNEWRDLLQPHVYGVLTGGGNWAAARVNVLIAAGGMGNIAATLTSGNVCQGDQLKAAFHAAKANTVCLTGGVGGGAWCSFEWL